MTSPSWIDPKLTVGNILTIAIVLMGVASGWYAFDTRLTLLEAAYSRMQSQTDTAIIQRNDLTERVIRIEEKVNALDAMLRSYFDTPPIERKR